MAMQPINKEFSYSSNVNANLVHQKYNLITTEAICIYSVTTSVLWSFTNMLGKINKDGGMINTQSGTNWWYTPSASVARGGSDVDGGFMALIECANFCYGSAMVIFASVLFMRIITNTIIPHPRNKIGEPGIAYYETTMLAFAVVATIIGMFATALGTEPRTAWAVFAVGVCSFIGFIVCYTFELAREKEHENPSEQVIQPVGVAGAAVQDP